MKKRPLYILAICFATLSLATDVASKHFIVQAVLTNADTTAAGGTPAREARHAAADSYLREYQLWWTWSVVALAAAAVTWLLSLVRREPGWHNIPLLLLILAGLERLIIV